MAGFLWGSCFHYLIALRLIYTIVLYGYYPIVLYHFYLIMSRWDPVPPAWKAGNTAAAFEQCELLHELDSSKERDLRDQIAQYVG